MTRYFRNAFFLAFLSAATAGAGVLVDSLFRAPDSLAGLIAKDSLLLAVRGNILARVANVAGPGAANARMRSPDVVAAGPSSFSFFWADSNRTSPHAVYRREIGVTLAGGDLSLSPVTMCNTVRLPTQYLHGARGQTKYLSTFLDNGLDTLKGYGDLPLYGRDSIDGTHVIKAATTSAWKADTFLTVYENSGGNLLMRSLYFVNNFVTESPRHDTVATVADQPANPAVAADNAGNVVASFVRGAVGAPRLAKIVLFDASRSKVDSIDFPNPVDTIGMLNLYDDVRLASYDIGKFGLVSWDNQGILYRSVILGSPPDTHSTVRLAPGPSSRYPAVSSNGKYIAAVWITDSLPGGTKIKVSGIRDTVFPGYVPFSSGATPVSFADDWVPSTKVPGRTTNSFNLNCAVDSSGNVAATWPIDTVVMARIWANRTIRTDSGIWVSATVKFLGDSRDSVRLFPDSVTWANEVFFPRPKIRSCPGCGCAGTPPRGDRGPTPAIPTPFCQMQREYTATCNTGFAFTGGKTRLPLPL